MHIAACNGYTNVLVYLLQQPGLNINAVDNDGNTALHLAAFFLQYEAAMHLAQNGANLETRNRFREKPIVISEDTTMIRLLSAFEKHAQISKVWLHLYSNLTNFLLSVSASVSASACFCQSLGFCGFQVEGGAAARQHMGSIGRSTREKSRTAAHKSTIGEGQGFFASNPSD